MSEERNNTIFCISLETKVPQDGATQPIGVNYPITRKYSYFLLGLKTGRGVKLIRINPVSLYVVFSSFFFFFLHAATPLRVADRWKENRLKEKWRGARGRGGAKVARFDAILNYSFNEANRTGLK